MDDPVNDPLDESLDLRGLKCPLPAMLARKALAALAPGSLLTALADDPMALVDIPHMCHREGHTLEATERQPSHAAFRIRAKTAAMPEEEAVRSDPDRPDLEMPGPAAPHPDPDG